MPVQTLDDVTRYCAHQRTKLIQRVESATPPQRAWRPAPDRWTLLEHVEHIALSVVWLTEVFEGLVAKARHEGLTAGPATPRQADAIPALVAAGNIGKKFVAPAVSQPTGRTFEESLALMEQWQPRLMACVAALPELDTDQITWYHPIADVTLNLAQLWHFIGLHEGLHAQHVLTNLEAWAEAHPTT